MLYRGEERNLIINIKESNKIRNKINQHVNPN